MSPAPSPVAPPAAHSWTALCLASALLPFANGGQSITLAAWFAPFLLLRFTRTQPPIRGLPIAALLQAVAFAVQFRGMIPFPLVVQAAVVGLYSLAASAPYFADRLCARAFEGAASTLVFPAVWTATEFALSFGPFGTWCSVAYSQHDNLSLLQLLAFTGTSGITFLIAWAAAAGNSVLERGSDRATRRVAITCAAIILVVLLAGSARMALFPPSGQTVRIASLSKPDLDLHPDAAVAGRFARHESVSATEIETIRARSWAIADHLLTETEHEAQAGARIVFWGEGNALILKEDEAALLERGRALAQHMSVYLGMALASWHLETTPHLENKLVLMQPHGVAAWEYYKARPVPGREAATSVRGDGKIRVVQTPFGRIGAAICFDADFPRLFAHTGRSGADIVLVPSNDWKAIDPYHTWMASFRAIEQGCNMVRQTSHGLSAAFDYQGRELGRMDHFRTNDHTLVVNVPTRGTRTFYNRCGDWFGWLCCAGALAIVGFSRTTIGRLAPQSGRS